jgi:hypothetical protein
MVPLTGFLMLLLIDAMIMGVIFLSYLPEGRDKTIPLMHGRMNLKEKLANILVYS